MTKAAHPFSGCAAMDAKNKPMKKAVFIGFLDTSVAAIKTQFLEWSVPKIMFCP